ncbi:MAG: UbiA family prenyltransferase [Candidatus Korobacteraceae bacterium]|jgi:4-hydroxybenzoate polyprenyltransferase
MPSTTSDRTLTTRHPPARKGHRTIAPFFFLLRPHQWSKNILVLVPVLLSHTWNNRAIAGKGLLATICFCLTASATYIFNDLLDVHSDREHDHKKLRPLAAGKVTTGAAIKMAVVLFVASFLLAVKLPLSFGIMLTVYLLSTVLYSLYLKTKVILDICTLAGLYTIRLFAGGAATGIPISEWTAAFAMFCFLGLAAVKRYSELQAWPETGELTSRRGYEPIDKSTIQALGLSSMVISVLVLALYLRSPEVTLLYKHWEMLRLICPVLLYWFGRIWILAGRGRMHSDPIIFALRDRVSLITAAVIVAIGFASR